MAVPYTLEGKVVLITGAAGGIGAAAARALHARGARVVVSDLRQDAVDDVVAGLGDDRALGIVVDVTDAATLAAAVDATTTRFGGLDVVIANAGIAANPPTTVATADPRSFERILDVNLLGVWRTVHAALPQIIERRGHLLLTSSTYAFINGMVNAPYAMAKAGVEQLSRALRTELAHRGATAGVLLPGWVSTPIADVAFGGHPIATELVAHATPSLLSRPITPERVAQAVVRGIERRAARIIVPRRYAAVSVLRGIVNPLSDRQLAGDPEIHRLIAALEAGTSRS